MRNSEFKEIMGIMDEIEETMTRAMVVPEEYLVAGGVVTQPGCPTWLNFLNEVTGGNVEAITQLQEFAGTCLVPEKVWGKALVLHGTGVGKTTFIRILLELVGEENTSSVSMEDLGDHFVRAELNSKWLNISNLKPADLESPYFKCVVTGDPMTASLKYEDPFDFCPTCKLVFQANTPQCENRRCISVAFSFHPSVVNPNLVHELENEIYEIRHWAVQGLGRLNNQGHFTEKTL
ncbi:DUF5906 domain-containing protein [Desulfoluna butyratoxydans]|uniref:p-loop containing nucleoside triphosphate hydrolase n=1 Tax=Desulfoluna butyratoxydans TaxID=231438 RepID=A0A4U8YIJ0_9BACT|nr:DUF5906 domain-containing protein [Desulfoluna butyratoxydans]VFQ43476.1 p-loop containing nucleoside triphosphate hydrolase [Desulfoluna butyratoxydans]